jgi:hypothetical protein
MGGDSMSAEVGLIIVDMLKVFFQGTAALPASRKLEIYFIHKGKKIENSGHSFSKSLRSFQ